MDSRFSLATPPSRKQDSRAMLYRSPSSSRGRASCTAAARSDSFRPDTLVSKGYSSVPSDAFMVTAKALYALAESCACHCVGSSPSCTA